MNKKQWRCQPFAYQAGLSELYMSWVSERLTTDRWLKEVSHYPLRAQLMMISQPCMTKPCYLWVSGGEDVVQTDQHGVELCSGKSLLISIEPPTGASERIRTIRPFTPSGYVNILNIYASTLCSTFISKGWRPVRRRYHQIYPKVGASLETAGNINVSVGSNSGTFASHTMELGKWTKMAKDVFWVQPLHHKFTLP